MKIYYLKCYVNIVLVNIFYGYIPERKASMETNYKVVNGTSYHLETPDDVVQVLEDAKKNRTRVRIFYGDTKTGLDWMEENDVIGTIGRSCGTTKIPLLIKNSNSIGGGAILTNCIVRITIDKTNVYKHPKYHLPNIIVEENDDNEYKFKVITGDEVRAYCKTRNEADNLVLFIKGEKNRR